MAYIFLVRHGQNDWVKKRRLAGWTPGIQLNDAGRKQAAAVAERLAHLPVTAIYSSPLERCRETAEILAEGHGLTVETVEELGEVRYGEWQGQKLKKLTGLKREWHAVQYHPGRFRFPAGESFLEVQHRMVAALETLAGRHEKEAIVVVSHADVIKLALAHYLGLPIDLFQRLSIATASVSTLTLEADGVRVLRINDCGPLEAPPELKAPKAKKKAKRKKKARRAAEADALATAAAATPPAEPGDGQEIAVTAPPIAIGATEERA
jgi:probable phosphoglycerate mutase